MKQHALSSGPSDGQAAASPPLSSPPLPSPPLPPSRAALLAAGLAGALALLALAMPSPLVPPALRLGMALGLLGLGAWGLLRLQRAWQAAAAAQDLNAQLALRLGQLRRLADNLPDVVVRFDRQHRHTYVNAAVRRATGLAPEDFIGRSNAELGMPAEQVAQWVALLEQVFATGQAQRLQFDFAGPEGVLTWESLVVPEFDAAQQVSSALVISRDVTVRRRLEDALRASEQRLALLLNGTPAVIYCARYGGDNACTFYSENVEQMLGHPARAFVEQAEFWRTLVHADDGAMVDAVMARLGDSGHEVMEYRIRHADGRWRWLRDEMRLLPPAEGAAADEPATLVGSCLDISERHQAEAEVRRLNAELAGRAETSEARYRAIFETMPVAANEEDWSEVRRLLNGLRAQGVEDGPGWFASHPEFVRQCLRAVRVLRMNPQSRQLLRAHIPEQQLSGLEAVFSTPEDLAEFIGELEALWHGQRRYSCKRSQPAQDGSGRLQLLLSMSLPSLDEASDGVSVVCFVDITELDRLNAELDQTLARVQRVNRELETFTYSVSHDLKAPLRGIDGYSRLLLRDHAGRLDAEGRQFLGHIRGATQQMGQLIDDLLAYSRLERHSVLLAPLALAPLARQICDEVEDSARQRGARLRCQVPEGLRARADAQGLAMALRNLVDNALKFARPGVAPDIELGGEALDGGGVRLWVRDNGLGFDMKFHDRIFEIFQRLHRAEDYPGTGIGLAIVRRALERMGGRVRADSRPGEGASFFIDLPGVQA
ncbi:MAG: PAS domain S-box protein [Burkholderiaceae bacterium]|nr:PAS domain S-box protein [Burkholderiaceae bacterium]